MKRFQNKGKWIQDKKSIQNLAEKAWASFSNLSKQIIIVRQIYVYCIHLASYNNYA